MATIAIETLPEVESVHYDRSFEIIEGEPREKLVGSAEVVLANLIALSMNDLASGPGIGRAFVEVLIKLRPTDRSRFQPDLIYLSSERWPRARKIPTRGDWLVVPDLAVEVVSPSNMAYEIEHKVVAYLEAGVRLVWIIHPPTGRAYIHENPTSTRVVTRDGELDGGAVLPGFRLSMDELLSELAD